MKFNLTKKKVGDYIDVTDFVANGSFASLKANVKYLDNASPDKFAVLVRTLDFNRNWNGEYVWVDKPAYYFLKKSSLIQGDLVLCNVGSVGIVFEVPDLGFPMTLGPNSVLCRTKDNDTIRQRFIYYYFLSSAGQALLEELSGGSTVQPKFNKTVLRNSEIDVPDLAHQDYIIRILGSLDAKISANDALSKTLEDIAQTIFKSWFIDFDPGRAKMAGEKPVGMDAATAAQFPNSMVDSELGLIPKGWEVRSLDEISEYLNGLAMQKFPVTDEDEQLPVIKIAQLRAGNTQGADVASGLLDSRFIIKDGDILFSWSGTLEVETWAGGPGALNQHLFKVSGKTVPDWYSYLSTKSFLSFFREIASGKATTMGHIQRGHLSESKLAIPNLDLLNRATEIIEPLISLKIKTSIESRNLAEIRDSLLPRLISGELQIPNEMLAS